MANPNPNTEQLVATQFKPGSAGGPGRPRKKPVTAAYEAWLAQPLPLEHVVKLRAQGVRLPPKPTNADLMALAIGKRAQRGDPQAAKEIREGVQGKAPISLELHSDQEVEISVTFEPPVRPVVPNREKIIDVEVENSSTNRLLDE